MSDLINLSHSAGATLAGVIVGAILGFGLTILAESWRASKDRIALLRYMHGDAYSIVSNAGQLVELGIIVEPMKDDYPDFEPWKRSEYQMCLHLKPRELAAYRRFYAQAREWQHVLEGMAVGQNLSPDFRKLAESFEALPVPKGFGRKPTQRKP